MALPSAITALFKDVVQVRLKPEGSGDGGFSAPSVDAPISVRARVSYNTGFSLTPAGDQKMNNPMVYMDDIEGFDTGAQITLPDGTTHIVDQWRRPSWPDGSHHLEVML